MLLLSGAQSWQSTAGNAVMMYWSPSTCMYSCPWITHMQECDFPPQSQSDCTFSKNPIRLERKTVGGCFGYYFVWFNYWWKHHHEDAENLFSCCLTYLAHQQYHWIISLEAKYICRLNLGFLIIVRLSKKNDSPPCLLTRTIWVGAQHVKYFVLCLSSMSFLKDELLNHGLVSGVLVVVRHTGPVYSHGMLSRNIPKVNQTWTNNWSWILPRLIFCYSCI